MSENFKLQGNRTHLRTEKELEDIDKAVSDEAFKKYKSIILDEYLSSQGFIKYKTNAYVRQNKIDVLEYIGLQKERYGSKTFTVNYAIMPLYVLHNYLVLGFGGRLGELICDKDIWWDYADKNVAQVSFRNVAEAIDGFVLPWFDKYSNEKYLMEKLLEDKKNSKRTGLGIAYKNEEWINAIVKCDNKGEIIAENIKRLKLPKK